MLLLPIVRSIWENIRTAVSKYGPNEALFYCIAIIKDQSLVLTLFDMEGGRGGGGT